MPTRRWSGDRLPLYFPVASAFSKGVLQWEEVGRQECIPACCRAGNLIPKMLTLLVMVHIRNHPVIQDRFLSPSWKLMLIGNTKGLWALQLSALQAKSAAGNCHPYEEEMCHVFFLSLAFGLPYGFFVASGFPSLQC